MLLPLREVGILMLLTEKCLKTDTEQEKKTIEGD